MNREQAIAMGLIKRPEQPLPDLYWQQCGRKIAHYNWKEAFEHALNIATSSPTKDKKISVYCCPWGVHFHVGHKPMIDWSSYVPRADYNTLLSKYTTSQIQLSSTERDRNNWRNKYEKKCNELAQTIKSLTPSLEKLTEQKPAVIIFEPEKYPKLNKVLAKVRLKLL